MSQPNNPSKPTALGRGLDHLIGPKVGIPSPTTGTFGPSLSQNTQTTSTTGNIGPVPAGTTTHNKDGTRTLRVTALRPGKGQPRRHFDAEAHQELVESIRQKGVLQPILVRPVTGTQGSYEIITGERRWRASQEAGLTEIPVVIRDMNDQEALEIGLIENIQRQDLNPIEEAMGYKRLLDHFGYNHEKLSSVIAKSRSHITNTIRLLTLPQGIQQLLLNGKLTAGHARALINCPYAAEIADKIVAGNLSVRDTEAIVRDYESGRFTQKPVNKKVTFGARTQNVGDIDQQILETQLETLLHCPVTFKFGKNGGEIVLKFDSMSHLDEIIGQIVGKDR